MALRPKLGPGSGVIPGTTFFEEYQPAMKGLFDASALPLTNIGGSPDDVTADLYWELDAGLIDGMKFTLTWAASNGGPMTLSINGGPAVSILDAGGNALTAGVVSAGQRSFIEFIGGSLRILSGGIGGGDGDARHWVFASSGTWEKPPLPSSHVIFVEAWGGGGGGRNSANLAGGGGGAYVSRRFRASDIPGTVSVSIGAGGTPGSKGGNTTFGNLLIAYGGHSTTTQDGGDGGGLTGPDGYDDGGGPGFRSGQAPSGRPAGPARNLWGGGGGGGTSSGSGNGNAVFGGGGGGRGISVFGGDGGHGDQQPGQAPGGGGGSRASGARGEVRIWA